MRDYITHVGGFLVIGYLLAFVAAFYAVDAWWVRRIRAKVAQQEHANEIQRRYDRMWRRMMTRPSPIAIRVAAVDASSAADLLIEHTGGIAPLGED